MKIKIFKKPFILAIFLCFAGIGVTFGATIKGKVFFEGIVPKKKTIQMDQDPKCLEYYQGQKPPLFSSLVVNENKTVQSVFVYIGNEVKGKFQTSKQPVVLDQKGCRYLPRVIGMMAGQELHVTNKDATKHNFHLLGKNKYNRSARSGKLIKRKIKKAGSFTLKKKNGTLKSQLMSKIKCDFHPWMSAYLGVMPHPFYSITRQDGTFEIPNLPQGKYTLVAWHEKLGTQMQAFVVAQNEVKTLNFTFSK